MSNKHQISDWLTGCIQREIAHHIEQERQRIIKLLEKHDSIISRCCVHPVCCLDADALIALIKGEK